MMIHVGYHFQYKKIHSPNREVPCQLSLKRHLEDQRSLELK